MLTVLNVKYSVSAWCLLFLYYVLAINFINIHVEALISLKISTGKGWKTWTLVYTWNHLEIYWCFSDCGFLCLSYLLQTCVVSVYPALWCTASEKYFVPLEKTEMNYNTAYIIWSNLQGNSVPEKEWHPNHVVTLCQNLPRGKWISFSWASPISRNIFNTAVCEDSEEDFLNISMLNVINNRLHVEVRFMLAHFQQQNLNKYLIRLFTFFNG